MCMDFVLFTQDILSRTLVRKGEIHAFLELHIEQGPLLERESLQLGIVTAIAAPAALRVTFKGGGGHAGALLMPDRQGMILSHGSQILYSKHPTLRDHY